MTSEAEHYYIEGEAMCAEPLLYRGCGLDGIYLCNGYEIEEIDGETFTYVQDREGLHKVIALNLAEHRKTLAPKEIRFMRVAIDHTQSSLAKVLGVSSQTVARWEKGQVEIPGPADRMLRVMVLMAMLPDEELAKLIREMTEHLDRMDETNVVPLQFRHDREWREAA
ncbi:transcriptional regulator, XRE family [Novosphingobium aromaticivorans DSM 12444]|uniref:Transcriptional regulator, XRE family n=1 Tax=Novosphingobium aromaticivorans (strain ATCC 700278 / DSM 12444 / CCUG 56034 / CIP 105152 / NBRC 16084 / F199) TaxID=279238 RepID=Q2G4Q6_NOVAD|nr:helix-turn-helix domain-containing protein [Novosphingobium aromaticivorans]ABD27167.1 transcriptional regulator, XRE family [Novosphingobium aromaticivorans DSM 12444]SCY89705.1 transcriptional regulator, XRE family [Novosphingobium aromaticivorans]